jgi:hypothetical protein
LAGRPSRIIEVAYITIIRCQGAWASMRESFALLDEEVGGVLYLTVDKESESKAGEECSCSFCIVFVVFFCCFWSFCGILCVFVWFCMLGKKKKLVNGCRKITEPKVKP